MHVVLVNYEYPPVGGGGGVITRSIEHGLKARGHRVDVVTTGRQTAASVTTMPRLISFPLTSLPSLVSRVRGSDIDVINGHFSVPSSLALPLVSRLTDIPLVVNVMGADVFDPTRFEAIRPALDLVNDHYVLSAADHVIAPSTDMRDRLPSTIRAKTSVVPYFVDIDRFDPGTGPDPDAPIQLLAVCRLVQRKNLKRALTAVARIRERGTPVRYTIVGDGPRRQALQAHAKALELEAAVEFVGTVSDDALTAHYRKADVFLLPSTHEAFGVVFLEALASGLPVVTSTTGGQTDIVTDDVGTTVDASSPAAIANGIERVLADRSRMADSARTRVCSTYTADQVLPQYERIYESVCRER